jgi:hypothetical protein
MMRKKYGLNPGYFGFKAVFFMLERLSERICIPERRINAVRDANASAGRALFEEDCIPERKKLRLGMQMQKFCLI